MYLFILLKIYEKLKLNRILQTCYYNQKTDETSKETDESVNIQHVQEITLTKGSLPLGICLRRRSFSDHIGLEIENLYGAAEQDSRLKIGDVVISINNESMKYVSPAQVKSILSRANLLTGHIP